MTRQSKAAVIRQGQRDAEILTRILRGEKVEGETRIKAQAERLRELAARPAAVLFDRMERNG